jgi:hypothetical protein
LDRRLVIIEKELVGLEGAVHAEPPGRSRRRHELSGSVLETAA